MSWHTVIAVGTLGRDPEARYLPNGNMVCNFSIAIEDGYGEQKKTIWTKVASWGKTAEACNQYLKKGRKVLVEGRLTADEKGNPRTFTRNDGTPGASFEISASTVRFLGGGENEPADSDEIPY